MASLTVLKVKTAKPGRYSDGEVRGLRLVVAPSGSRSWVLRVQVRGKRLDHGLGGYPDVELAEARDKARALRKIAKAGGDPRAERDKDLRAPPTFKAAAEACHEIWKRQWTEKHAAYFLSNLTAYAFPIVGSVRVDTMDAGHFRDVLEPIWKTKPETARKLRHQLTVVLEHAKEEGWRTAEVPGRHATKRLGKLPKPKNFPAMPHAQVPSFVKELDQAAESMGRLALLFTIFTAARSGEVRSAKWSHIDFEAKLWRRPGELMKSRQDHVVTLSDRAISILKRAKELRTIEADCPVFPGKGGKSLSDMTLSKIMRERDDGFTVHGFRSSFRDWVAEKMPLVPDPVAEAALAHIVSDAVVAAYKRTTFLDMRRQLLDAWSTFLARSEEEGDE